MAIEVGDKLPQTNFTVMGPDGPSSCGCSDIFDGRTVVLFAVPGAFTPTCDLKHLPGFINNAKAFKEKGVDEICCTAVNDIFVLDAWGKARGVGSDIKLLADGSGAFTKAIGMELDLTAAGLGVRSKRYAMLVVDGVVAALNVEDNSGELVSSSAEEMMKALDLHAA